MEKIAILSDVHGNVPALEAVLKDIRQRNISKIICLGDMIGKGPCPAEAIDMVKKSCDLVIRGNWEEGIITDFKCDILGWHKNKIGKNRIEYLKKLPFSIDFYMSGRLVRLFHASPISTHHRVLEWASFEERFAMFDNTELTKAGEQQNQPDVVGYGDVHNGFIQNFKCKTLFNVGSVGNPLDIPQASYAIIEGCYNNKNLDSFSIHLVRVPYDVELAIEQARDSGMPELGPYIQELKTAKFRGLKK